MKKRRNKKMRDKLDKNQLKDMMENKLRAKTIQSSKLYQRSKNKHRYYDD